MKTKAVIINKFKPKINIKNLACVFFSFCFCFCLFGCEQESSSGDSSLKVYASFYGAYDFARQIGGDKIHAECIVPIGYEPHNWEPASGDMLKLSGADILFYNGAGMESWVDKAKEALGENNLEYVALSEGVSLIYPENAGENEGNPDFADPHIWLDPKNAKIEAETIKNALSEKDPENADVYSKNYESFAKRADELDRAFRETVLKADNKTIVVAHEAYGYLCRAYGIKQLAIEPLSADSEPSPAKMAEISQFIKDNNIKYIFYEELSASKAADTIAEETGAKLLPLSPFEGLTQEELNSGGDYFSVMYKNLENIKTCILNLTK